jgi:hypothetical protein
MPGGVMLLVALSVNATDFIFWTNNIPIPTLQQSEVLKDRIHA